MRQQHKPVACTHARFPAIHMQMRVVQPGMAAAGGRQGCLALLAMLHGMQHPELLGQYYESRSG